MKLKRSSLQLLTLAILLGLGCSKNSGSIAGPSETTNGTDITLAGTVLSIQSHAKQSLYIYSKSHHPIYGSGFADTLNIVPHQKTEFTLPDSGIYNLFLFNAAGDSGAVKMAVQIKPNLRDTLHLDLAALGSISGSSTLPVSGAVIYVRGSGFGTWLSPTGTFQLKGMPAGDFMVKAEQVFRSMSISQRILDSTITLTIHPNDSTTLHFK